MIKAPRKELFFAFLFLTSCIGTSMSASRSAWAQQASVVEPYRANGITIQAVEHWPSGGYNGGSDVTFGLQTAPADKSQMVACGKQAYFALKAILDSNPTEFQKLRDAGRTSFYIIISDWTGKPFQKGSTWFYSTSIQKFHCGTTKPTAGQQPQCECPSRADVLALAATATQRPAPSGTRSNH